MIPIEVPPGARLQLERGLQVQYQSSGTITISPVPWRSARRWLLIPAAFLGLGAMAMGGYVAVNALPAAPAMAAAEPAGFPVQGFPAAPIPQAQVVVPPASGPSQPNPFGLN